MAFFARMSVILPLNQSARHRRNDRLAVLAFRQRKQFTGVVMFPVSRIHQTVITAPAIWMDNTSGSTRPRIIPWSVAFGQSGTIGIYAPIAPEHAKKKMILPRAPQPLTPLTRLAPKRLSSTPASPLTGDSAS